MDGQELFRDPGLGSLPDPCQSDVPQMSLQTPLPCEPEGQTRRRQQPTTHDGGLGEMIHVNYQLERLPSRIKPDILSELARSTPDTSQGQLRAEGLECKGVAET